MNNIKNKNSYSFIDIYIMSILLFTILIFKSIKSLLEIFSYGIFKKQILTEKSNIGFDIKIKIK